MSDVYGGSGNDEHGWQAPGGASNNPRQGSPGNAGTGGHVGGQGGDPQWQWPAASSQPEQRFRLRPLTTADVLDLAFKLFRTNFKPIAFITILFAGPIVILSTVALHLEGLSANPFTSIGQSTSGNAAGTQANARLATQRLDSALVLLCVVGLFVLPLISGSLARLVAASYLNQPLTAGRALRAMKRRWLRLLWANFLVLLIVIVVFVVLVLVIVAGAAGLGPWFGIFALPALVFFALFVTLFTVVTPAIAVEEVRATAALSRSWRLLRPRRFSYLGTLILSALVIGFFGTIVRIGLFIPAVVAAQVAAPLAWPFEVLSGLGGFLVWLPLTAIVATLLYFDARVRQEGFDLQMMTVQFPPVDGNFSDLAPRTPPTPY